MRPYEVMVIFDVGADPSAIQGVVDRLLETLRNAGGSPGQVDRWGRRPFAYEVKHRHEGYYVLVEFEGEQPTVAAVDRLLSLADEALRHKVIRVPDRAVRVRGLHNDGRSSAPHDSESPARQRPARRASERTPTRGRSAG